MLTRLFSSLFFLFLSLLCQVAFNYGREPFVFDFVGFIAKREEEVGRG